jgi:hypothetical protein
MIPVNQLALLSLRNQTLCELSRYNYNNYKVEVIVSNYSNNPLPSELYIDVDEQHKDVNPFLTIERTPVRLEKQYLEPGYECGVQVAIKCIQSIIVEPNSDKKMTIPICLYSPHNGPISNVIPLYIKVKTSIQI